MDALAAIWERLGEVRDPELQASIVELGMVRGVTLVEGRVRVEVALTTAACPLRGRISDDVRAAALVDGVSEVEVVTGVLDPAAKATLMDEARRLAQTRAPATTVPRSAPVIMIASGKGGVGKSSVSANLAVALAREGRRVGVLDADIWGFSLARLLGIEGDIAVRGGRMVPITRPVGAGSISLLSMGHLAPEDQALMWRGLVVQKAVSQFLEDADWSGIDLMVIDTPPGTGDIVMTLARLLPHLGQILVTTPAAAAQQVAARAGDFARRYGLRSLGVIENMSAYRCSCGEIHAPFGTGGGEALAHQIGAPLLASIPLRHDLSGAGDAGTPVALDEGPDGDFAVLARRVASAAADLVPSGCSARLLDALDRAVSTQSS